MRRRRAQTFRCPHCGWQHTIALPLGENEHFPRECPDCEHPALEQRPPTRLQKLAAIMRRDLGPR